MSDTTNESLCQEVDEQMASVIAGDADPRLLEHIAECDRCRDARYDAQRAIDLSKAAGDDYMHPDDFDRRVLDAIDAAAPGQGAKPVVPVENAPEETKAVEAAAPRNEDDKPGQQPSAPTPIAAGTSSGKRRHGATIGGAIAGVAALAAAAAFAIHVRKQPNEVATSPVAEPWKGKVVAVQHAGPERLGGLQRCAADGSGCSPVGDGAEVPPGSLLRTDARTRAHVELSDGTTIAVDRTTDFVLPVREGRVAEIRRGVVVADVQHIEAGPNARFDLPGGAVEVLGTKLTMTASEDRSSVEVIRGTVKLTDKRGEAVTVHAGEEGSVSVGGAPSVARVTDLSDGVVWSERGDVEGPEEASVRGVGELRARKPGSSGEVDQAVRLTRHDVKIRIVDSVARTEIDETFSNDTGDVLEGIYRFPLPPDAQIERLALEVDGRLEEGAFVDRDRAAAIWRGAIHAAAPKAPMAREEIVWVPGPWRDPALLEWQRGGRFELRIYPIPARGSRRVVLAYTQTIAPSAGVRRYVYPLSYDPSGSTRIDDFNVDMQVRGHDPAFGVRARGYELTASGDANTGAKHLSLHARSFVPSGDLTLEFALPQDKQEVTAWAYQPGVDAQPSDDTEASRPVQPLPPADAGSAYVAIALRPKLPRWTEGKMRDLVIVVDASRSMVGERYKRAAKLAESIVREMDRRDRFGVLACDVACVPMDRELSTAGGDAPRRVREFLARIEPEGGTDLVEAMRSARSLAGGSGRDRELRVIYVGDGTPSVGMVRPPHIMSEVSRVLPPGTGMLNAVAVGSDADTQSLAAMARGGGGVLIPYVPGERSSAVAMRVLGASYGIALRNPSVELPEGLTDVHPRVLDNIPAGGETIVVARMTRGNVTGSMKLKGQVGGESYEQSYPIELAATGARGNAFVPRLYAATKISDLESIQGDSAKQELIDLSKRFAVASKYTSLLVLESAAMFRAFGLDRATGGTAWSGEDSTLSTVADGTTSYDEGDAEGKAKKDEEAEYGGGKGGASREAPSKSAPAGDAYDDASPGGASVSGGRMAGAYATPPPAAAVPMAPPARRAPPMACDPNDPACGLGRGARGWVPMRRVWDRKGSIASDASAVRAKASEKIATAEGDVSANPDSRSKLEKLLGLYAIAGQIDRASELAERWSARDAMDPGALVARADIAARKGDRALAIRILTGMADLRPADASTQTWLASLFDTMGDADRSCRFRMALAGARSSDASVLASAIRCARSTGYASIGDSMQSDIGKDEVRRAVEAALTRSDAAPSLRGDLRVEASWDTDVDLDIALIGKNGQRYSWLGDPRGRVTARDVTSTRVESLAVNGAPAGDYIIEITRADGRNPGVPVRGRVTVSVAGTTRTLPFSLSDVRTEAGSARVYFESRLVPY
jgi:hypothetical protein